jgi:hypothetical protein
MLRRVGMQLGLGRAGMGGGGKSAGRWWALTVLVPLLCGAVPIFLVDSVLRDVKLDVSTWQSQIAQLTEKARGPPGNPTRFETRGSGARHAWRP